MGKSIILGDIMPASLVSEVNGAASKSAGSVVNTKVSNERKLEIPNCGESEQPFETGLDFNKNVSLFLILYVQVKQMIMD